MTIQLSTQQLNDLEYSALDSAITYQCMEEFWRDVYANGHEEFYQHTIELLDPLMAMMLRGIYVDAPRLDIVRAETQALIEQKQEQLNQIVGRELNANSPKQIYEYFYGEKQIPPYTNSQGKPTTDDKALTRIARGTSTRRGYPEAKLIQEIRGLRKLKGTYLDIEFDADGRFRTSCNPRGTTTGRISTGKTIYDTGMNMQNLPESYKKILTADPGYLLVELDKRQAEWVVVAYDCGDQNMIATLERGDDPHTATASLMFDVSPELINYEKKVVGHSTDPVEIEALRREHCPEIFEAVFVPRIFSMRQAGKKSNHALNYDETYKRFAFENEMQEGDSKRLVEAYHRIYPAIRQNYQHIQQQLRKDRTLENCFGQRRTFLNKWGDDLFKQAYSYRPQSTVAYIVNRGLIDTYNDTAGAMAYVELLAQVHDSILFQIPLTLPTDEIVSAIKTVEHYMNPTMNYWGREFQIETDVKLGTVSWGELPEADLSNISELTRIVEEAKSNGAAGTI